ncbi:MAG: nucleoside hydrolase [Chloroflexi bacterium]|nr:nucleoside hydrolase [Chloroflexota bacterium]
MLFHRSSLSTRLLNRKLALFIVGLVVLTAVFGAVTTNTFADRDPVPVIIDTEPGVDDATALAWLFGQDRYPVEVLGITTVAGNTSVENATNNVLTLLETAGRTDIPVIMGVNQPSVKPLSHTPSLLHGPDGLWFVGMSNPHDLSAIPNDVAAFYRDTAVNNPGAKLVALGPLTNLADAIELYPIEMALFSEIIVLGGAKNGGNQTPVAEFNFWQDPEAADYVLSSSLPITIIPLDTFSNFTISQSDIDDITQNGTPVAQLIAGPLQQYANVQMGLGGAAFASVPDVTAVMVAVQPNFVHTVEPALVKIITHDGLASGESVMGFTFNERIMMIADDAELSALADQVWADPNFDIQAALYGIYLREPENADIIMKLKINRMHRKFIQGMQD